MIYHKTGNILIRDLTRADADAFVAAELEQGWRSTIDKFLTRLRDASAGECLALVADLDSEPAGYTKSADSIKPAGYINVYFRPHAGPFAGRDICCIVDFGVLEKYRRRGVGSALMDAAEAIAAGRGDEVCLGVGLYAGYGNAQRMYVKRGYIPDGSGVWYNDAVCPPYTECVNNDDLILHMSKKLR